MNKVQMYLNLFNKLQAKANSSRTGEFTIKVTKALCEEIVNDVFDNIHDELKAGNKVSIPQLGIFKVKQANARSARNPKTGEKLIVPAHKKVSFSASKGLRADVK